MKIYNNDKGFFSGSSWTFEVIYFLKTGHKHSDSHSKENMYLFCSLWPNTNVSIGASSLVAIYTLATTSNQTQTRQLSSLKHTSPLKVTLLIHTPCDPCAFVDTQS